MRVDKTLSELWYLVDNSDVGEVAKMAINTIQKLQKPESKTDKKTLDFVKYLVIDIQKNYPVSTEEAYEVVINSMKNMRRGILNDALHLIETDRTDFN
ncbi:hypothetical protein [Litchfieldia alkalitelluris]|uniref:hypothetical protein n=1 Tax=Litchfieldia alkalitelluris TaxID=304268 RepID=UPI00099713F4|nr:hypothetical protein [Litchfieldia alkalitelluris]